MKKFLKKVWNFFKKVNTRFSNYKNTKKYFVVYLVVLTFFLLFPIIRVNSEYYGLFFSMWRSLLVILVSLIWLFCWNLSVSFKNRLTKLCSLREDEPLVDFILLWMIVCVFMWIMDVVSQTGSMFFSVKDVQAGLSVIWYVDCLLLLWGLIWSFISLQKVSNKASRRTKILNIVEEDRSKSEPHKSAQVTHLFDDLGEE